MSETPKNVTYTDAPPRPGTGVVLRSYYLNGVHQSTVCINAAAGSPQRAAALEAEQRFLRSTPAASVAPQTAPAVNPKTAAPPKSKERLAREDLYRACLAQNVKFDAADALAVEVGVMEAASLIRAHGPDAAFVSMASRFWGDRGVKTAPSILRTTSEVVGWDRAAAAYERRAHALEPGRADERTGDVFGTEAYAGSVYASREVAR